MPTEMNGDNKKNFKFKVKVKNAALSGLDHREAKFGARDWIGGMRPKRPG